MSLTFSRYVRFIFHACPVLALQVISLHCRADWFPCALFPFHSFTLPCFHFCPFHVPFSSPLFTFHFPLLSCHVDFLFPPLISLHFLACPLCSPVFPAKKNTVFPVFSQRGRPKTQSFSQIFSKRRQEAQASERAGRGNRAWDPCFATPAPRRLRLVERHQIAARYVGDPPAKKNTYALDVGR